MHAESEDCLGKCRDDRTTALSDQAELQLGPGFLLSEPMRADVRMEIVAATSAPADRHELPQAALPTAEEFNPESRKTDLADSAQVRLASPRSNRSQGTATVAVFEGVLSAPVGSTLVT